MSPPRSTLALHVFFDNSFDQHSLSNLFYSRFFVFFRSLCNFYTYVVATISYVISVHTIYIQNLLCFSGGISWCHGSDVAGRVAYVNHLSNSD